MESLLGTSNISEVEDIVSSTGIPMTSKKIERYIKAKSIPALETAGEMSLSIPNVPSPMCSVADEFLQLLRW